MLALPLMVAGTVAAHLFGSALFAHAPSSIDPDRGVEGTARASHGLLTQAPLFVGVTAAFLLVWLGHRILSGKKEVALGWFFLLPPVALVAQEVAERLIHAESFPFNPVHEPAFLAALALQIPFGLASLLLARLLLAVAVRIGRALSRPLLIPKRAPVSRPARPAVFRWPSGELASGHSSRSPPLAV